MTSKKAGFCPRKFRSSERRVLSQGSVKSAAQARGILSRHWLMTGASTLAFAIATPDFVQARSLNGGGGEGAISAPNIASEAATQAARQAAAAARQTQDSLARAARAVQDIQAVQAAARAAAAAAQVSATAPIAVPNGLGAGGLLPNMPAGWNGASAPTQSVDGNDQTQVNIRQQAQQAILNWQSFNIGARTTLTFDQGGNASWVALNRVDASTGPSQILGNIRADGHVYVINQSGIIFGGNSQINVGSLIAAAAKISDDQFLKGIYSTQTGSAWAASFTDAMGAVRVEAGALIVTAAPGMVTAGGGFAMLLGKSVINEGTISTPKGQALLAAGDSFILRPGFGTDGNTASTTRGSEVSPVINAGSTSGRVANRGLIFAQQGDITLAGRDIAQDGALIATTSVNTRGTIHLLNRASDAAGSITLGGASLTAVLPELDSEETALDAQRNALITASDAANLVRASSSTGAFDNLSLLADRQDQSRIEIVSGGSVVFRGGSYTAAQGGQIAVSATRRITTESGATLDVSGVRNVALSVASNNIKVNVQGNELRDSPQNRDSDVLKSNDVWIDVRNLTFVPAGTGGYASDRYYTPGGLLEVGGYLGTTAHRIGEWAAVGGSITLAAPEVVAQKGATFDLSGGSLDYAAGWIRSTNLVGSDGRRYSVDNAPSWLDFVSFAGGFVRMHNIQGKQDDRLTEIWTTVFDRGRTSLRWEDAYTVGRDAGRLVLSAPTVLMDADIIADVINGRGQNKSRPTTVTDGYKLGQRQVALEGALILGNYNAGGFVGGVASDVRITRSGPSSVGATDPIAQNRINTAWLDGEYLSRLGLGRIELATSKTAAVDADVSLADGGRFSIIAPNTVISAKITAHGGDITVTNIYATQSGMPTGGMGTATLKDGAVLDVSGVWTNNLIDREDLTGQAFVNGGSVRLEATGDVRFERGSLIEASSGAVLSLSGALSGGRGGDVSLIADSTQLGTMSGGALTLDGDIRAYGVTGGGTLKVGTGPAIAIGGSLLGQNGMLRAGERAPVNLTTTEAFTVAAGQAMPFDYRFTKTVAAPGEALTGAPNFSASNPVTLAADWTPPLATNFASYTLLVDNVPVQVAFNSQPTIRAGATITVIGNGGNFPSGYIVPGNVFPGGLPIAPVTIILAAGQLAPSAITFAAGTLLPAGAQLPSAIAVKPLLSLDAGFFSRGFSNYQINGHQGVVVAPDATIDAVTPVYRMTADSVASASGARISDVLELWTPPLQLENAAKAVLTQRAGASITLASGDMSAARGQGYIEIGRGATLRVDPSQSIRLETPGQITVDGALIAPGGRIDIIQQNNLGPANLTAEANPGARSIWIGEHALLDVSGRSYLARDRGGRVYGTVLDGGTITIGAATSQLLSESEFAKAAESFVVVRAGAVLNASGTSGAIDVLQSDGTMRLTDVASNGGTIAISSYNGLYLDGTLKAAAGGAGAAGGVLALTLETPAYLQTDNPSQSVRNIRELVVTQDTQPSLLPATLGAGVTDAALAIGKGRISAAQIAAGGFGDVRLFAREFFTFDGNVTLSTGQAIRLYQGFLTNTVAGANVSLAAPYVLLSGRTGVDTSFRVVPTLGTNWASSAQSLGGTLRIDADHIDIGAMVRVGARGTPMDGSALIDRRGYDDVILSSRGDIRFLGNGNLPTTLIADGDLTLIGAQVYPDSGAQALVTAGLKPGGLYLDPARRLTIGRAEGVPTPLVPLSVGGQLTLSSATIVQGGILRAPLGGIILQGGWTGINTSAIGAVRLLDGSLTSVSGAGLLLPYGGTIDGLKWIFNGKDAELLPLGGINGNTFARGIQFQGRSLALDQGAVLDLSGGGELIGAGFVSGRGGSVDIRTTALANANPGNRYSSSSNAVFAIVPSRSGGYAPSKTSDSGTAPKIGQQITIPAGVPGLAAGTYTLMPSEYALLPGAFRVEIGAKQTNLSGVTALPDGSFIVSGRYGTTGTDIRDALANRMIVTPASVTRTLSLYNETSFRDYVLAEASRTGNVRAMLPADAGTLQMVFNGPSLDVPALRIDGTVSFAPDAGGLGGTASATGTTMEVTAGGRTSGFTGVSIDAAALTALGAARLGIGAMPSTTKFSRNVVLLGPSADSVIIRDGAVLRASEIIVGSARSTGSIVIEGGAVLSTIGMGNAGYDAALGFVHRIGASSVLIVSNSLITLLPDNTAVSNGGGRIEIGLTGTRPAELYGEGTIGFATRNTVRIGDNARYGARDIAFAMETVNFGEQAALDAAAAAGVLPTGLNFNQAALTRLLAGNQGAGIPAIRTLTLSALKSMNFFGTLALDARGGDGKAGLEGLILNTPAIYGLGSASETASIKVGTLYWNGILNEAAISNPVSQTPGAVLAGGAGTGHGRLSIEADTLMFGPGPYAQPRPQFALDKLVLGFGSVDFKATQRITSNGNGTLTIYEQAGTGGASGTGGALSLTAPVLTGEAGSINKITAGGAIVVAAATTAADTAGGLGAEIGLKGASILVAGNVLLPSGKLTLEAAGDVRIASGATLDLSGRVVQMYDQLRATPGGHVVIESAHGNVTQEAGSIIDVSATYNQAGSLSATALDAAAGQVALMGTIRGSASGYYDAGGTYVPWLSASVMVRAQTIVDFAGLNARLGDGGVFGARSFQIKQGDLVVGDELKANSITLSVDGGSLTVTGRVDASGERVGTIRLAARDGLTLTSGAVLDAHGTKLRVDSYGQPIDAANRPVIELTAAQGMLTLSPDATIDLRSADSVARGSLVLNAPRVGADDVAIAASGPLNILGARTIALNAFRSYTPADGIIDQAYMNAIHADSTAFIDAALLNGALRGRIAGLTAYTNAFHLRPGVEIASTGKLTISGDIDLSGYRYNSLNPLTQKTGVYGSGEAAALTIRAGGDLDVKGSINDGFAPPPGTPDDKGWLSSIVTFPGGVVTAPYNLPAGAIVPKGATFATGTVLDFDAKFERVVMAEAGRPTTVRFNLAEAYAVRTGEPLPIYTENWDGFVVTSNYTVGGGGDTVFVGDREYYAGDVIPAGTFIYFAFMGAGSIAPVDTVLPRGTVIQPGAVFSRSLYGPAPSIQANVAMPALVKLTSDYTITSSMVATGTIVTPTRTYNSGETIAAGTVLAAGSTLGTGTILPFSVEVENVLWPKGIPLAFTSSTVTLAADSVLTSSGVLPAGTTGIPSLSLRQGKLWAVAPMLASGSESWSLRLAAGSDIAAADSRALSSASSLAGAGSLTLDDLHYINLDNTALPRSEALSVLRTGTGDLDLLAGRNFVQKSLFGVYTAGTQSAPLLAADGSNPYDLARGVTNGSVLGPESGGRERLVDGGANSIYQAWYPELGGNVLVAAQGDVYGYALGNAVNSVDNAASSGRIGNWLWRQGGAVAGQQAAWWINFGTYVRDTSGAIAGDAVQLTGFSGIGALGGGNVTVRAGGNAGVTQGMGSTNYPVTQALNLAIGGTGRVTTDGRLILTGGGDLTLDVGGKLNGLPPRINPSMMSDRSVSEYDGTLTNLRGAIMVNAGSIGMVQLSYGSTALDPRAAQLFTANAGIGAGGMIVAPGDATVQMSARGDLVLGGAADPGRVDIQNTTPYSFAQNGTVTDYAGGGRTGFSLWTGRTAIDLLATGGNLTPVAPSSTRSSAKYMDNPTGDNRDLYPSILRAVAAEGSIYYGPSDRRNNLVLAPSANGQLELLAGGSIYAGGYAISMSGADASTLATPFRPAFLGGVNAHTNVSANALILSPYALFAFGADTITTNLHAGDTNPARIYAVDGDIVGFNTGTTYEFNALTPRNPMTWRVAAKPMWIIAGRDIVSLGTTRGGFAPDLGVTIATVTAGLVAHSNPDDVSILSAGRDIVYANLQVAGPGTLEVSAGRNILQEDRGSFTSIGPVATGDSRPGASIALMAGMANGADWNAIRAAYLDPARQADADIPLAEQTGKVAKVYTKELAVWLLGRYGFKGSDADALAYFDALAPEQQRIFLRQVYFDELREGGREYNNTASKRFGSYLRGRQMIATLFPGQGSAARAAKLPGDIVMFGGSGVHTDFGGDIEMLTPTGQIVVGVQGAVPPASAGVVTQGAGDIRLFSEGSILLGLSRIMTTFGGDIVAWSATGDINAGRGAKTTVIYTPPKRTYDRYGRVTLAPQVPSSGAGIATLNPIPEVLPGDIDLIAPLGTIDAGEAGIRVSGNVNLAALQVLNAANIQVQGTSTGIPTVQAPSIAAALSSSNATAATQQTTTPTQTATTQPSVIIVEVLGYGGDAESEEEQKRQRDRRQGTLVLPARDAYNERSAVQIAGYGVLSEAEARMLTEEERAALQRQ